MNKSKDIDIDGQLYRIGKLRADEGSHIHWRMLGVLQTQQNRLPSNGDETPAQQPEATDEEKAKMLCSLAFMLGLSYEDTQFSHRCALRAVSRVENINGNEHLVPIMTADGRLVPEELQYDAAL